MVTSRDHDHASFVSTTGTAEPLWGMRKKESNIIKRVEFWKKRLYKFRTFNIILRVKKKPLDSQK